MPWWAVLCAALAGAAVLAASLAAAVTGIRFFRKAGALARLLEERVAGLERLGAELERRSEDTEATRQRLSRSMAALDASLARARILGWALRDVRTALGLLRAAVPGK
jgi:Skp family chaperone for outer membrane proteins